MTPVTNLAMSVVRGRRDTAATHAVPEPGPGEGSVLVRTLLVGVCGTDLHLVGGTHRASASGPDAPRLVLGHEAVGLVVEAPPTSGFAPGQLVTGIVRRPCAECAACARGDWDFCTSGAYTERGIKGADGFGRTRWRSEPAYLVPVPDRLGELGVLVEPMSVVCKALETAFYVARRGPSTPARLLVTGAGPIGLLAAAAGRDAGLDVTVLDRMRTGVKPDLVTTLGAAYTDDLGTLADGPRFDLAFECSGAAGLIGPATALLGQAGVMMLIAGGAADPGSVPPMLLRANAALVGTVNAGRRHYAQAVDTLLRVDRSWLCRLLTRRVPLTSWQSALDRDDDEVKVVVEF
ncbi:alcohol dehydrogenase catalytic domain-containing protein [Actinopolymorpha sp. B17G11]